MCSGKVVGIIYTDIDRVIEELLLLFYFIGDGYWSILQRNLKKKTRG